MDETLDLPIVFDQTDAPSGVDLSAPAVTHNGQTYVGRSVEALQKLGIPASAILAGVKSDLFVKVDAQAELERARWLTPGAGQAMEYQEVRAQGQAALAAGTKATAERFPMLAATIGIDIDPETKAPATDILGVARSVVAAGEAWAAIGTHIRVVRLRGKAAIEAATTIDAARAAFEEIDWSLPKA
ncbi:hypothetical protein [Methylorubrum zatmanii]